MDIDDNLAKDMKEGFETIKAPPSVKHDTYASCLLMLTKQDRQTVHSQSRHDLKALYDLMPPRKKNVSRKMQAIFASVACLILLLCGYGGYSVYSTETAYISIDVNPSIEFGLNRFNLVVSQKAYNDDGQTILENVNLTHKSYEEALKLLLADPAFKDYLTADNTLNLVVVTDDTDKESTLLVGVKQCMKNTSVHAICHGTDTDLRKEATHCGMSAGKYQAYLELSKLNENITIEDCHDMSISEINDSIRFCHKQNNLTQTNPTNGNTPAVVSPFLPNESDHNDATDAVPDEKNSNSQNGSGETDNGQGNGYGHHSGEHES